MLSTELSVMSADVAPLPVPRIERREESSAADWSMVSQQRLNAVVIGPRGAVDAALSRAFPDAQWGASVWTETSGPDRFRSQVALVRDAQTLTESEQQQLLAWMDRHPAIQVITVADRPLHPLVVAGTFDSSLYYRLNIFYFVV